MGPALERKVMTVEEFLQQDERVELIRGCVVQKAGTSAEHASTQAGVLERLSNRSGRVWWLYVELDVQFGNEVFRPDICGYRRDRLQEKPAGRAITARPDWVCEILSPSHAATDRVEKLQTYFTAGVPHYWMIDPLAGHLEIYRRTDLAYALVQSAHRGQRLKPEPFDALEFSVDELLGGDPDDD